jgi:spore maturation protein CgeB
VRADFFSELELRLNNRGYHCCFKHIDQMPYSDQVNFIQRSRINFNFWAGCYDGAEKSWGLPERCYGVPACGGFLLSDAREHAHDDFIPGEERVSFGSIDDVTEKVSFFLQRYDTARTIAERAHARVMREHT